LRWPVAGRLFPECAAEEDESLEEVMGDDEEGTQWSERTDEDKTDSALALQVRAQIRVECVPVQQN
jgi:hypothetical protein